jgi:hypothetical protein
LPLPRSDFRPLAAGQRAMVCVVMATDKLIAAALLGILAIIGAILFFVWL